MLFWVSDGEGPIRPAFNKHNKLSEHGLYLNSSIRLMNKSL